MQKSSLILVTGLSGAGMSSVLKTLEDMRLEVFDNFPLHLLGPLLNESDQKDTLGIAVGIDSRTRGFDANCVRAKQKAYGARLLFITCDDMVLQKRFSETRRRHPLARCAPVSDGIEKERLLLAPLQDAADLIIDTSDLSVHDLRHILEGHFAPKSHTTDLAATLISFGFRHGLPREADTVLDVRFLINPHWTPTLQRLTGQDPRVAQHIETDSNLAPFLEHVQTLFTSLLPLYAVAGKRYLTFAVGCTGGKHRSVYCVERFAPWLCGLVSHLHINHRDIDK